MQYLGSARASRAGDRALAIADFFVNGRIAKNISARAPKCAREGARAPQSKNYCTSTVIGSK